MTFRRNWTLILILIPLLYIAVSCGSSDIILPGKETFEKFEEWKAEIRATAPNVKIFTEKWEETVKPFFSYDGWEVLDFGKWKDASGFEIWQKGLINCHLINNLILDLYPGCGYRKEEERFGQLHEYLICYDEEGIYYISFAGVKGKVCRSKEEIWTAYKEEK